MCENDAIADAYIQCVHRASEQKSADPDNQRSLELGHLRGALRELAATVPGVRDWMMRNLP